MKMLRLVDALRMMEGVTAKNERVTFDIKGVKYNRKSKSGGSTYSFANCQLPYGIDKPKQTKSMVSEMEKATKKPSHYANATRNIQLPTNDLVKINIWLIQQLCFQGVTYEIIP